MIRKIFSVTTIILLVFLNFQIFISKVSAQSLLPAFFQNLFDVGRGRSNEFATSRVQMMLLLTLGVLIIAAIFYAFLAGWKYIRSQGDQSQIDEATKAIQAIFMGLGAMLVSIIGIVLVFVFFGATLFDSSTYQTCLSAPNSIGCNACNREEGGLPFDWEDIKFSSENPELDAGISVARGSSFGPATDISSQQVCVFCEWEFFQSRDDTNFENQEQVEFVCFE